jgi:hypothetical protein
MKPSEKAQERIGATVSNIPITVKSLLRLLPGRLLPDDVIEAFCSLIQRKAINQNVHIFPPLFTYKLMQSGPGSVNKHSRRVNLVSKDMNTLVFIYTQVCIGFPYAFTWKVNPFTFMILSLTKPKLFKSPN